MSTISIAMATYNGESYLKDQLQSILSQTRTPDELIIFDDDSTDNSQKLIEAFARTAPFPVKLYRNEKRLGSTKNFEKAIRYCQGELIFLADQDDVWREDKLQKIATRFSEDAKIGLVFSDADLVDERLAPLGKRLWRTCEFNRKAQQKFCHDRALDVLLRRSVVTGATMAFRASYKEAVLPFPVTPHPVWIHDAWIAFIVACMAKLAFVPEPLILYRQHANNQIGAKEETLLNQLVMARARGKGYVAMLLKEHRLIQRHLQALAEQGYPLRPDVLELLREKEAHLEARIRLPSRLWRRLGVVWQEAASWRYTRYSAGGVRNAVKDLLGG
jgi:glycosyltransferase involved in cell wall biosynthesis